MRMMLLVFAAACLVALAAASGVAAHGGRYYMNQVQIGDSLEANGFPRSGRVVQVDSAFCIGLRRYGVQTSAWGLDKFWRFKCTVSAADEHMYEVQLATHSKSARYWHLHVLSAKSLFD